MIKMPKTKHYKQSLKPIPPTLRGKKRYVLFELIAKENAKLSEKNVDDALWKTFLELYGSVGTARQRFWPIKFDSSRNLGIVRCALEALEEVKAGLLFVKNVNGAEVIPKIISVSGSIKQLKAK